MQYVYIWNWLIIASFVIALILVHLSIHSSFWASPHSKIFVPPEEERALPLWRAAAFQDTNTYCTMKRLPAVYTFCLSVSMKCVTQTPQSVLWRSWHVHKGALQCRCVLPPEQWTGRCFHPVNTQTRIHYERFCCLLQVYRWKKSILYIFHINYMQLRFPDISNGNSLTKWLTYAFVIQSAKQSGSASAS